VEHRISLRAAAPLAGRRAAKTPRQSRPTHPRAPPNGVRMVARNTPGGPMKGDAKVIEHLQAQLKNELTAINQYFLHYRMYKHWGLDKLAKKEYDESMGEMKHADKLMDRIFVLDGLPNLQDLGKLMVGEDVPEALACDLKAEQGAQATIKDGMAYCETVRDYVSRDLLQGILDDTEEHIDFLETQIELIDKVGLQNYLQSMMGEMS
jgi:bacterioferritin